LRWIHAKNAARGDKLQELQEFRIGNVDIDLIDWPTTNDRITRRGRVNPLVA